MKKILVMLDLPYNESLAALGWHDDAEAFGRALCAAQNSGALATFVEELFEYSSMLIARSSYREDGHYPGIPYLDTVMAKDNLLALLTKNGMTKSFSAPVRTLSADDLFSFDYGRNFENLDAVFLVDPAEGRVRQVMGSGLVAFNVVCDYRDGWLNDVQEERMAASTTPA